jgi:hypothetical protein
MEGDRCLWGDIADQLSLRGSSFGSDDIERRPAGAPGFDGQSLLPRPVADGFSRRRVPFWCPSLLRTIKRQTARGHVGIEWSNRRFSTRRRSRIRSSKADNDISNDGSPLFSVGNQIR